jgi:hypothetical protein
LQAVSAASMHNAGLAIVPISKSEKESVEEEQRTVEVPGEFYSA